MQINKINLIPYKSYIKQVNTSNRQLLNSPIQDTVAFKGGYNSNSVSKNTQSALNIADKLLEIPMKEAFSIESVEKIIHKQSPDVKVCDIKELKSQIPDYNDYGAFFSCKFDNEYNVTDKKMYINISKANKSPQSRLSAINDIAHEYTHARQMDEGKIFEFLKSASNGDGEYSKAIQGIGDFVFKPIDTELQAKSVLKTFYNSIDIFSNMQFGFFYPREQKVSKQDILDSLGLRNEKEFKDFISDAFDYYFYESYQTAMNTPDVAEKIPKNSNATYEKLHDKVKTYCAHSALKEKEAYTTESLVSKKYLKKDKSLNIDIFPIYYEMVYEALSSR